MLSLYVYVAIVYRYLITIYNFFFYHLGDVPKYWFFMIFFEIFFVVAHYRKSNFSGCIYQNTNVHLILRSRDKCVRIFPELTGRLEGDENYAQHARAGPVRSVRVRAGHSCDGWRRKVDGKTTVVCWHGRTRVRVLDGPHHRTQRFRSSIREWNQ